MSRGADRRSGRRAEDRQVLSTSRSSTSTTRSCARMNRRGNGETICRRFSKSSAQRDSRSCSADEPHHRPARRRAKTEFAELCEFLKEYQARARRRVRILARRRARARPRWNTLIAEIAQRARGAASRSSSPASWTNTTSRCIGKTMQVLCEGYDPDEESYYGRTYADSPGY